MCIIYLHVDIKLVLKQHNDTHTRVEVAPLCLHDSAMLERIDLDYCVMRRKRVCETFIGVTQLCKEVNGII